jgi:hypothetical protein
MKIQKLVVIPVLVAVLAASGCSSVKRELGVGRNSPDEFTVVKRAPLTLPPDYDLRPPAPGSAPPASDSSGQAKNVLLGKSDAPAVKGAADDVLLSKMGATHADPAIRETINRENGYIAVQNKTVADKLIFWKDEGPNEERIPSSVVDPKAEKERIEKNQAEGKPVNDGKVPTIEKKKSTLDKIF